MRKLAIVSIIFLSFVLVGCGGNALIIKDCRANLEAHREIVDDYENGRLLLSPAMRAVPGGIAAFERRIKASEHLAEVMLETAEKGGK